MNPESGLPDRMPEPPSIVIHSLAHARIAIDAATDAGNLPVLLLSAPDAGCFMGSAWWLALMEAAAVGHIHPIPNLLDCGDAAGRAMQALRLGQKGIILDRACPQHQAVLERAIMTGAMLRSERPLALDLAEHGAARRLGAWLIAMSAPATASPELRRDKTWPVG
jgi:hypothetical protein